jgi:ABC-2 type transport system permease protein
LITFRSVLAAEWVKVRTVRSTVWTPVVMIGLVVGLSVFVGATKSLQSDDTVLGGSLTGAVGGQIAAAIFGVLVMSAEYGSGLVRVTLLAAPRRGMVLAAKALVVAAVTFGAGLITAIAAHQVGVAMLSGDGYAPGRPMPALVGVAVAYAAAGLLGLALGALLRRSAAAITAMIGIILAPSLFGPLFGDLQRWVGGASPLAALQKLTQTSDATTETVGSLGAWPSLAVVCGYTAAVLVAAAWAFRRRDVTG